MNTRDRFKKTATTVPQNKQEATMLVTDIGRLQAKIDAVENAVAQQVAAIEEEANKKLKSLLKEQENAVTSLYTYATKYRAELAPTNKTIQCASGVYGWRNNTPTVVLSITPQKALEVLKQARKKKFIRIKESLNKELLLKERPVVAGISYEQREEFYVKPKDIAVEKKTLTRAVDV